MLCLDSIDMLYFSFYIVEAKNLIGSDEEEVEIYVTKGKVTFTFTRIVTYDCHER